MALVNNSSPFPLLFGITMLSLFVFILPKGTLPNASIYEKGKIPIKGMFTRDLLNFRVTAFIIAFAKLSDRHFHHFDEA